MSSESPSSTDVGLANRLAFLKGNWLGVSAWPIICLVLCVILWEGLHLRIEQERSKLDQSVRKDMSSLSRQYSFFVSRSVDELDQVASRIENVWEHPADRPQIADLMEREIFRSSQIAKISIFDRNGIAVVSSDPAALGSNAQDTDYFNFHKNDPTNVLLVGIPVARTPTMLGFTRRIHSENGAFDGVVVLTVQANYFTSEYANRSIAGKGGMFAVVGLDGTVRSIAMGDGTGDQSTEALRAVPLFDTPQGSNYLPGDAWFADGRARYVAWDTLNKYPLISIVGRGADDVFAPYREVWKTYDRIAITSTLLLALFGMVATTLSLRLVYKQHQQREISKAYRTATEGADEGFYMWTPLRGANHEIVDFVLSDCNERGAAFYGTNRASLLQAKLSSLYYGQYFEYLRGNFSDAMTVGILENEGKVPETSRLSIRWANRRLVRSGAGLAVIIQDITARKLAEQALRDSEIKFKTVFQTSNDGILIATMNAIVDCNQKAEELLRCSRDRLVGSNFVRFSPAQQPDGRLSGEVIDYVFRSGLEGKTRTLEYQCQRQDGTIFEAEVSVSPLDLGDERFFQVLLRDITERKRAVEALRRNEELLREAAEAAKIGVYVHHFQSNAVYWSPEQRQIIGVSADEPVGVDLLLSFVHPDDRSRISAAIERANDPAGDGRLEIEHRIIRRDGAIRWLYTRGHTFFNGVSGNLRPVRAVGAVLDVTAAKEVEERLHRSQAHLARAQMVGHIGSAELDLVKGEDRWSDEYFRLLGLNPASATPSAELFKSAVLPEDREKLLSPHELANYSGSIPPVEFRIGGPDSEMRWLRRHAEVIRDEDGNPGSLIFTLQDITDTKLAEERRLALERQLGQAQKMEAVGQLTGGVAHDFNNLLAVVLGRLQMVDEELADKPQIQSWVRSSIKALDRGATLTKSLLAFSRQQTLMPVDLDLNALLSDMEDMLRRTFGGAFDLHVVKAPDLWLTEADPGQLQNALLNLILNARDAMPLGGKIEIETANEILGADDSKQHFGAKPGDYVMLSVSDTGVGIPPELLQRVIEPFFTTKGAGKGSGLGLSMVYGFAKQSGGHISIASQVGRGTSVHLCLPRKTKVNAAEHVIHHMAVPAPKGAETILVVEDNHDLRDLTRLQLTRLGYKVLEAAEGAEGLRVLADNPDVDLLLSDVILSHGMSGPDMVRRALMTRPDLKVVYMSGYNEKQDALDGTGSEQPLRLLQKPFAVRELAAQIRAALD